MNFRVNKFKFSNKLLSSIKIIYPNMKFKDLTNNNNMGKVYFSSPKICKTWN